MDDGWATCGDDDSPDVGFVCTPASSSQLPSTPVNAVASQTGYSGARMRLRMSEQLLIRLIADVSEALCDMHYR